MLLWKNHLDLFVERNNFYYKIVCKFICFTVPAECRERGLAPTNTSKLFSRLSFTLGYGQRPWIRMKMIAHSFAALFIAKKNYLKNYNRCVRFDWITGYCCCFAFINFLKRRIEGTLENLQQGRLYVLWLKLAFPKNFHYFMNSVICSFYWLLMNVI